MLVQEQYYYQNYIVMDFFTGTSTLEGDASAWKELVTFTQLGAKRKILSPLALDVHQLHMSPQQ